MNFAEMWSPGAAADAALDVSVAELLWRDVEKRRKNAWLRPIGFVARLFVYALLFGLLFIFMPESIREGWITTKPFAALTLGDVLSALVWTLIGFKILHSLFHPNPRPDFRESWGRVWHGAYWCGSFFNRCCLLSPVNP
jgi:cytochrome c biogenesis protein CcdA